MAIFFSGHFSWRTKAKVFPLIFVLVWAMVWVSIEPPFEYQDPTGTSAALYHRFLREQGIVFKIPSFEDNHELICPASKGVVSREKKVTVVIMSYSTERLEQINWILECYRQMTGVLDKIIFVWNNLDAPPPDIIFQLNQDKVGVPIQLYNPTENIMTNRFDAPSRLAFSDAPILLVDDDVFLEDGLIGTMMEHWEDSECQEQCIVGLDPRYADPDTRKYRIFAPDKTPNLIIGKTLLVSNNHIIKFMEQTELVSRVSSPALGCEDITFSLFVTNSTNLLPSFVKGDHFYRSNINRPKRFYSSNDTEFLRYDLPEPAGLSSSKSGWTEKRNNCVELNIGYFGDSLANIL